MFKNKRKYYSIIYRKLFETYLCYLSNIPSEIAVL